MNTTDYNTSLAWQEALKSPGEYEHHCYSAKDIKKIKRFGRAWQRILNITKLKPSARLFELGCGGGIHLANLAVNGFEVHGIDISDAVIARAQNYLEEVRKFQSIKVSVEVANIFEYETSDSYDMCFHFGVVEHFLDISERQQIWNQLYALTKPGGWIVSVVPCGQHFLRKMIREKGLAGYNIPEIDYSSNSHKQEFEYLGLNPIFTKSHNYFSFLSAHPSLIVSKVIYPTSFLLGNVMIPSIPISENVKEKWAQTLIVIGKKQVI